MKIDRSCLLLFLLPCLFPAAARSDARTLDASGQAEIRIAPDEVVLTLGVETDHLQLEYV